MGIRAFTVTSLVFSLLVRALAEQCGSQAGGAECPGGLCCSQWGWCGTTDEYCCTSQGCQSNCRACAAVGGGDDHSDGDLESIISKSTFEEKMLPNRNRFYTYEAFIEAAKAFPDFGTQGNETIRKKEIAAFFGQTSHETNGGWDGAPGGKYAWGYVYIEEIDCKAYCNKSYVMYPCAPGKKYCGRGPMQLSWNYNYGQCGKALGLDLLNNPELVKEDPVIAFKAAIWFWMTPQAPKPSCHDVIIGKWKPSAQDLAAGRVPGYGVITNIINGDIECGSGENTWVKNRIGFYEWHSDILGVDYGDNLDCYNQKPFGSRLLDLIDTI